MNVHLLALKVRIELEKDGYELGFATDKSMSFSKHGDNTVETICLMNYDDVDSFGLSYSYYDSILNNSQIRIDITINQTIESFHEHYERLNKMLEL